MNSEVFEKMPPSKLFFRCAIPAMITSVFGALYSIADGIFVGRFVGEDALAAINLMMPILLVVTAVSNMIATGCSVQISMLLGQKKREDASRIFSFSVKIILLLSFVIGIVGFLFAEPFVRLISPGATAQAIRYCVTYLTVYAVFAPLLPIYFATDNYLRICGKEKFSMVIGISTQLLNVVLDMILIAGFRMGVWAAAFSSCISMAIGSVGTLMLFAKKRLDIYYIRGKISLSAFLHILANGFSEFFTSISSSATAFVMNIFLLRYGGTTAVAAMSVMMYVDSIVGMMMFGICDSLQPAISYCYGAGNITKVKALFHRGVLASITLSALSLLFLRFAGRYATPFFVKPADTDLLAMSIHAMNIFAYSYLFGWVDTCFSSLFTALDRPLRSLATAIFGTFVFPVAFLFLLSSVLQLDGVWLMPTVAGAASGIVTVLLAVTLTMNPRDKGKRLCHRHR